MTEKRRLVLKGWTLPLIVAGLVLPGTAGVLIAGPGLGLAMGELCAVVLVITAARLRPDIPIEVARPRDPRRHLLVLAAGPIEDPGVVERIASRARPDGAGDRPDVLVLAPARTRPLSYWLSDTDGGRDEAQVSLVHSLAALAAADVEARGQVGDAVPLQATEDMLRSFPAEEVVMVSAPPGEDRGAERTAAELQRRLAVPFAHLVNQRAPSPRRAAGA